MGWRPILFYYLRVSLTTERLKNTALNEQKYGKGRNCICCSAIEKWRSTFFQLFSFWNAKKLSMFYRPPVNWHRNWERGREGEREREGVGHWWYNYRCKISQWISRVHFSKDILYIFKEKIRFFRNKSGRKKFFFKCDLFL